MAPATDSSAPTPTVFLVRTFMMPSYDVLSTTPWFSPLVGQGSSIQRGSHGQERTTRLFMPRSLSRFAMAVSPNLNLHQLCGRPVSGNPKTRPLARRLSFHTPPPILPRHTN